MTPGTLRRRLQKKRKRKPYRKCSRCGGRSVVGQPLACSASDSWRIFKECQDCDQKEELFVRARPGGGMADTYPTGSPGRGQAGDAEKR